MCTIAIYPSDRVHNSGRSIKLLACSSAFPRSTPLLCWHHINENMRAAIKTLEPNHNAHLIVSCMDTFRGLQSKGYAGDSRAAKLVAAQTEMDEWLARLAEVSAPLAEYVRKQHRPCIGTGPTACNMARLARLAHFCTLRRPIAHAMPQPTHPKGAWLKPPCMNGASGNIIPSSWCQHGLWCSEQYYEEFRKGVACAGQRTTSPAESRHAVMAGDTPGRDQGKMRADYFIEQILPTFEIRQRCQAVRARNGAVLYMVHLTLYLPISRTEWNLVAP